MEIVIWSIDRPKPYPKNARKWSADAVAPRSHPAFAHEVRFPLSLSSSTFTGRNYHRSFALGGREIASPEGSACPYRPRFDAGPGEREPAAHGQSFS